MEKNNFIELYIGWLKSNMKEQILETELGKYTQISTPFLDRHNDHLQIYVKQQDNGALLLTDGGYTINDLSMCGCDVMSSKKRHNVLMTILNGFGMHLNGEEIFTSANYSNFAQKKHSLIQAMLSVNDMFVLSRSQVTNIFFEDVQSFFDINSIPYIQNAQFSGSSGLSHTFEFTIPAMGKKPERFVKTINDVTGDKINSTLFSWGDIKDSRKQGTQLYVFMNDNERKIRTDYTTALEVYGVHPVLWSAREKYLDELTA